MAVIKLINALFLSGINGLIYLLARRFVEERAAQAAALLYLVTLFPTLMTCVLTNQHISAFFLLLAVYILTGGGDRAFCVRRHCRQAFVCSSAISCDRKALSFSPAYSAPHFLF